MSSSKHFLEATIKVLSEKLTEKVIETANRVSIITKEAPEKIRTKLEIVQEEIYAEAERISQEEKSTSETNSTIKKGSKDENLKVKIDRIRAKVSKLSMTVEK